ncbi:MAG TPA: DNA translocase FtsK 4TM domain-containing protein [Clostridia bacterium]|nr:DNA translocase FtsK 4TM domain-containing protein [Clostridia bacterium]
MAKHGRKKSVKRKNKSGISLDAAVVVMILVSILLAVLIYSNSGVIGEILSPMLGGFIGFVKYIIPIGTFAIALYLAYDDKDYLISKLIQYGILICCLTSILSIYSFSLGNMDYNSNLANIIDRAYYLGSMNNGGGIIGAIISVFLVKLVGYTGAIIIALGLAVILIVCMFGFKPTEMIKRYLENIKNRKEDLRQARMNSKNNFDKNEDRNEIPIRETAKQRREREKEESRKAAAMIDPEQFKINLDIDQEENKNSKEFGLFGKKKGKVENDIGFIENDIFKKVEEKKEEKNIKEEMQLQHAMEVEDENYEYPPIELLAKTTKKAPKGGAKALTETASRLQKTLYSFGVSAKVENVSVGPAITRYELKPAEGVRVSKIANLADDIALNLAAETIRIEAPIPGKQAVGIEIPNKEKEMVHIREVVESPEFANNKSKLSIALGKDVAGQPMIADIAKMPHVLVAGSTGSGKSVCINTVITSIIYNAKPSEVKLIMVDPKIVELSVYNGIPHLLIPVVTEPRKAAGALTWAVQEMEDRYNKFAVKGVRDLAGYNKVLEKEEFGRLPQIVIIIDELADLMMVAAKDVEDAICRLAQKARAAGMHLVIATQRPSVDVITGLIKANVPSRISFAVSSQIDSRTILDMAGAEKLLGKGDMLFYPAGASKPVRVQGAFISDDEVEKIVDFVKANGQANYREDIIQSIDKANSTDREIDEATNDDDTDPLLLDAIEMVVETGQASTSFIQRRFKVGYARAGRIIDQMEERGIISGYQGSKPREVLMPKERWEELKMQQES